jgi:hypothetical protein
MRFPVYEHLYFLNRSLQETVDILEQIKKSPGIPRARFEVYKVEIQYLRSDATQCVLEAMNDAEIHEAARLGKQKKIYDDSVRDLDDVYFEVQDREEQRRRQGLPSMIGILPRTYPDSLPQVQETVSESSEPAGSKRQRDVHVPKATNARTLRGRKLRRNPRPRR